jgi:hypothetical protein
MARSMRRVVAPRCVGDCYRSSHNRLCYHDVCFGSWLCESALPEVIRALRFLASLGGIKWDVLNGGSGLGTAGVMVWGATVMLVGDYFVWPTLAGGAGRLPFLMALVGIFGGLQSFGLIGLFLGPVIMASR